MPVTQTQRLLSLLACTELCAILNIVLAIAREHLGIGSWPTLPGYIALLPFYSGIIVVSIAAYRWLVDEQDGMDLHVHLFISMGAPGLVTWWSFTESFARIFGTSTCGW